MSISTAGFPFRRDLGADWWLLLVAGGEMASGIFCLLDRRPEDPVGKALLGLFSTERPFRLREDGVAEGAVGTSAAAGAIALFWAAWLAA
jgi:hypothetical protein